MLEIQQRKGPVLDTSGRKALASSLYSEYVEETFSFHLYTSSYDILCSCLSVLFDGTLLSASFL